jgi:hypothetical protein
MATGNLAWAQSAPDSPDPAPQNPAATSASDDHAEDARDRVLFSDETERIKPLTRKLTRNILMDQKEIWTSPFRIGQDPLPWILIGAGTAALIATDRQTSTELPNSVDQISISRHVSNAGAVYTVLPVTIGLYVGGAIAGNPKARETGILGGEAALDSLIVASLLKAVTQRPRPLNDNGRGSFFTGGDSFPSGHAIETWALASVVAHEYNKNILYPITAYGLASLVSFSRLSGRQHFSSDIFAGAAMGWFIGRYVFKTHVDHAIHARSASKVSWLRPQVMPEFEPGSRSAGVTLSWGLTQ